MIYAHIWDGNSRDAEIRNLTNADVHSLAKYRVNVGLSNIDPFFKAFNITDGQPMFRPEAERVVIW